MIRGTKEVSSSPLPVVGLESVPVSNIVCGYDFSIV